MKCPSCGSATLLSATVDDGLQVLACGSCGGNWVKSFEYWRWKKDHPGDIPAEVTATALQPTDSTNAKTCPECSAILVRYEVGRGTSVTIERCDHCCGMWFDRNEWEVLRAKGLHDEVHYVFSAPWQRELRTDKAARSHEEVVRKMLGDADYAEANRVKAWLSGHAKKSEILAYLK